MVLISKLKKLLLTKLLLIFSFSFKSIMTGFNAKQSVKTYIQSNQASAPLTRDWKLPHVSQGNRYGINAHGTATNCKIVEVYNESLKYTMLCNALPRLSALSLVQFCNKCDPKVYKTASNFCENFIQKTLSVFSISKHAVQSDCIIPDSEA